MFPTPDATPNHTEHARAARHAVIEIRAAKERGDIAAARRWVRVAAQALDRHLATLR